MLFSVTATEQSKSATAKERLLSRKVKALKTRCLRLEEKLKKCRCRKQTRNERRASIVKELANFLPEGTVSFIESQL